MDLLGSDIVAQKSRRVRIARQDLARNIRQTPHLTTWSVVGPLLRPWRWILALALVLNAIHGLAISFQNLIPKWLISDVLKPPGFTVRERMHRIAMLALAYLLISIVGRMLVWHTGYRIFTFVRERMAIALRSHFFRHVNHLCLRFHGQHPSGELFNYLFGSPLGQILGFYQHTSLQVVGAIFTVISTVAVVGLWDPYLTAVLFLTALASVGVMRVAQKRVRQLYKQYQETESGISGHVADLLRGNKAVKLYAMEDQVAHAFERDAVELGRMSYERDSTLR